MAGKLNLIIEKGSTFTRVFTWQTKDQENNIVPVDLSGYTAKAQFRETYDSPEPFFDLSTENGGITLGSTLGTITLVISASASSQVTANTGVWDIELYSGDYAIRLLEGRVTLTPEVTR